MEAEELRYSLGNNSSSQPSLLLLENQKLVARAVNLKARLGDVLHVTDSSPGSILSSCY